MVAEYARYQQRGGAEAQLFEVNETPMERELIVATDTGRAWVGDGSTPFSGLQPLLVADSVTGSLDADALTGLADFVAQQWDADA
jgi:hypothetical protein